MNLETKVQYLQRLQSARLNRRRFLVGTALAATSAALVACGDSESTATEPASGAQPTTAGDATAPSDTATNTLTIGTAGDISVLNPQLSTSLNDIQYSFNLFDNLVARRPDGQLHPMLATEWATIDDNTWEFKLRDDVTFHNGDPLTSADVKFTIERTYDPEAETLVATVFTSVESIETPDDYTVRFITKEPDPLLDARLAFYGGQIMPKKYFEEVGPDEFNAKPIGSGPVKFVEWVKDDHLTLEANADYWDGPIAFDTVIYKPLPELSSRVASLLAGESDIVVNLTPDTVEQVNESENAQVASVPYAGLYVLAVNSKVAPLDNPLIKQALSLAIDREAIVQELWRGMGSVPNSPIAKGDTIGYDPDKPPYAYDPDAARDLLQQAGYDNEPIYLETTDGYTANDKPMSDAIVAMWRDVGINAVEEVIQFTVRAQKNRDKSFKGMWWSDPTSTVGDPDGMMWRLLGPGGPQDYWREPEFDELGAEAHNSLDQERRDEIYRRMVEIFDEHFPWIPSHPARAALRRPELHRVAAERKPGVRPARLQPQAEGHLAAAGRGLRTPQRLPERGCQDDGRLLPPSRGAWGIHPVGRRDGRLLRPAPLGRPGGAAGPAGRADGLHRGGPPPAGL